MIWQLAAMALDSELLLPAPTTVLLRLVELLPQASFWARVGFSLARILVGFVLGAILGIIGACAAARWHIVETFLAPPMALAKSVPVASITVLALIWLRAANLAILVVLLVVLPVVYENTLQGLRAADPKLVDVAHLYHMRSLRRLRFLVMPTLFPYMRAALVLSLGTAWKAGVAAEVIGIPAGSLGEAIYDAKVYFDTPALFAVTLMVVLASAATSAVLRWVLSRVEPALCGITGHARRYEQSGNRASAASSLLVAHSTGDEPGHESANPQARPSRRESASFQTRSSGHESARLQARPSSGHDFAKEGTKTGLFLRNPAPIPAGISRPAVLQLSNLSKTFGGTAIIEHITLAISAGEPVCIMAPSGAGKTTLLHILACLEQPDTGSFVLKDSDNRELAPMPALSFQDDRLADQASVLANVRMVLPSKNRAWDEAPDLLSALGLGKRLCAPAGTCSGGERRRIGIARALLAPHNILLLDEPFNGLDEATKTQVAAVIRAREQGRIIVIASHDQRDAALLGARIVALDA